MKQRIYYLDVLRCLACIMVVLMHAPYPNGGLSGHIVVPISLFTVPCIGLFFMVSGALLLPVKETGNGFMKKRLTKVLVPLLVWTAVGILLSGFTKGFGTPLDIVRKVCSIPFAPQGHGVFWFMYALIGLYLVAPVVSPWLERCSQKELKMYLLLWLVTMSFPYLKFVLDVDDSYAGAYYYVSGYVGFFLLGYYLRKYGCAKTLWAVLWLPIPFVLLGMSKKFDLPFTLDSHFWYLCLPTAITAWSWFTIIRNAEHKIASLNPKVLNCLANLSNYSFGIYLMHIFIMRNCFWTLFDKYGIEGGISLAVSFLGTLVASCFFSWLISLLPFGDYIIGYKKKRI